MNIPEFTAQASLYRTSNRYRSSGSEVSDLPPIQSVVAAYHPGPTTRDNCNFCRRICWDNWSTCDSTVVAAFLWWSPGLMTALRFQCDSTEERCLNNCADVCCPQLCGPGDPSTGAGCCDEDESCVDQNDPNSRNGCCPSNQTVCDGVCCPAGFSCIGHVCTTGFPNTPPPPPPYNGCTLFGGVPCGTKCCYGGLQCCGVFNGQPDCKTSCLR